VKDNPSIHGTLKTSSIGTFMIVINQSQTETFNPEFQIDSKATDTVSVYGEDRTIAIEVSRFKDQFKPLDVHIYDSVEKVSSRRF